MVKMSVYIGRHCQWYRMVNLLLLSASLVVSPV